MHKTSPYHERNRNRNHRPGFSIIESLESRVLLSGNGGGGLDSLLPRADGHASATGLKAGLRGGKLVGPSTLGAAICTPGSVPATGAASAGTAAGPMGGAAAAGADRARISIAMVWWTWGIYPS